MSITTRVAFFAVLVTLAARVAVGQAEPLTPALLIPDEPTWVPGAGARGLVARVVGDSMKVGMYAVRVKFPPGVRVEPHFDPDDRIVTVLSGTVHVGYGEQFNETKMRALPAGSVWTEPANQPHFAWARDGDVILQVTGNGPSGTTPVRPSQ
jgi:quercetin dioxygenase-like cupin family protein